nr:hypothetical protein [Polaromonas sp. UBA4122]
MARLKLCNCSISSGHFLQRALQLVGHRLGDLLRRGARPVGAHRHGPEGKRRIFVLPELEVGRKAQYHQYHQQVAGQRRMVHRPSGQIELGGLRHAGLTSRQKQGQSQPPQELLRNKELFVQFW